MLDFNAKYTEYLRFFEQSLKNRLNDINNASAPKTIKNAMSYAVSGGGKRVRPVLCYSACEMLGGEIKNVEELALAIECIHSYSLVHDDLPAMDNDDYRRGKLSTHKKFGEAIGILAGDALLNFAFEILLSKREITENYRRAAKTVAEYAGFSGMIGGQVYDLENERKISNNEKDLYETYINKTAKLISAPLISASYICGEKHLEKIKEYGYDLGILFQITDDILDVCASFEELGKTPNKDEAENKLTAVKIYGLQGAKEVAEKHYLNAKKIINEIDGVGFLSEFTDKMYFRKS